MKNGQTWNLIGLGGILVSTLVFDKLGFGILIAFICLIIGLFLDPDLDGRTNRKRKMKSEDHEEWYWYNKYIKK